MMKKFKDTAIAIVVILVLLVIGYVGGRVHSSMLLDDYIEVSQNKENQQKIDLKLPGEKEQVKVTVSEIEHKLIPLSELVAYGDQYHASEGEEELRSLLDDIKLPFTANNVTMECDGLVKVGFNMEMVKVKQIDDDKIYVSLPEPEILDNYVIMDSIKCTESNNILNSISFNQYQRLIEKIEQNELQKLEQNGLYDRAEEHAKEMVISFLSAFEGYEVEFL